MFCEFRHTKSTIYGLEVVELLCDLRIVVFHDFMSRSLHSLFESRYTFMCANKDKVPFFSKYDWITYLQKERSQHQLGAWPEGKVTKSLPRRPRSASTC